MTDTRELLELAAKAGGITGEWARWHQTYGDTWVEGLNTGGRFLWNPRENRGDALVLAAKLRLTLQMTEHGACAHNGKVYRLVALDEAASVDEAACIAIVRAAAEIGRAMP